MKLAKSAEDESARSESSVSYLPASTRCIMIPELRWKIFDLVTRIDSETVWLMKKTLMALALSCKYFSGPAQDLVWRDLHSFEPLITCLPQSLWKQDGHKLEFQRTMTLDDWSIFCKYNYRVHSLVHQCREPYSYTDDETIGTEIWRALSCPPFSLPLLPNLTSLTWTEASDKTFQCVRLFATPKLTMLNISPRHRPFFTFGSSEQSILSSIAQSCPSVSYFDLAQERYGSTDSVGDTSTALQFWSHLTSVRTGTVSEAAILHLSNLPSLRVLKCRLPSTSLSTDAQKLLQQPVFCALQELDVTCTSLVILDPFLEKLTVTPKVLLSFTITRGVDFAQALPGLISRLSNVCTHNSLHEVRLSFWDRGIDPNASIGAAAFQPLFTFRNLRKLDFEADGYCIVRMDDASLLQMAKAWPCLEELYISRHFHSNYQVTLHAFVLLLWHCPRLRSVAVLVDWSTIDVCDISPDIPYRGFSQKALSDLFTSGSKIENPTSIAAFISTIAPNVRFIHGSEFEESSRWDIVEELLPMVREQRRRMMLMLNELTQGY